MSKNLDDQGQPIIRAFNSARNREKATYVLKGILEGINSNGKLSDAEILYLSAWMKNQEYLKYEADTLDLFQAVKHVLEDGIITEDERTDLYQLIKDIQEFGELGDSPYDEPRINEFLGLLKGIYADGEVSLSEIDRIEEWVIANKDISEKFPIDAVYQRIRAAKADNIITADELDDLKELVADLSGDDFTKTGDVDGSIGQVFCDVLDSFNIHGKTFCFTGKFLSGTRNHCHTQVESRGAYTKTSVTHDVDVLVIGTVTSRDWRFQNFGRKIERALEQRNETGSPTILSEEQWIGFISS